MFLVGIRYRIFWVFLGVVEMESVVILWNVRGVEEFVFVCGDGGGIFICRKTGVFFFGI